jgi:hypothetical protein
MSMKLMKALGIVAQEGITSTMDRQRLDRQLARRHLRAKHRSPRAASLAIWRT